MTNDCDTCNSACDQSRGLPPVAPEHDLSQWLPASPGQIAFPEVLRQRIRIGSVADGQCGQRLHILRDVEQLTRLVGQNADHLMDRKSACSCFETNVPSGQAEV